MVGVMAEKLAGVVQTCTVETPKVEGGPEGLLLRPAREWDADLVSRAPVRLVLPDGRCIRTKILGTELRYFVPEGTPIAILVELQPELDNNVPAGTLIYVDEVA